MSDTLTLTPFTAEHLPGALALSQGEAWPHRAEDWTAFLSLSQGVVALKDGSVAGTALATRFGDTALINMIIVGPALRGRGLGRKLVEGAMAATPAREFRLTATEAGLPLYRKMGFVETEAVAQHQGVVKPIDASGPAFADVFWANADHAAELATLDQRATGMDRAALIDMLLGQGRVAVLRRNGATCGWGAIRRFGRGLVAGPVITADAGDAKILLSRMLADHTGDYIRVDTPVDSGLSPWLEGLNLTRAGGGMAMSTAPRPHAEPIRSFALAAQALG